MRRVIVGVLVAMLGVWVDRARGRARRVAVDRRPEGRRSSSGRPAPPPTATAPRPARPRPSPATTRRTSPRSTRRTRRGRPSRRRSRARASSSTWATATAGRAATATPSIRRPRTASGSTRRPAAATTRISTSGRGRSRRASASHRTPSSCSTTSATRRATASPGSPEGTLAMAKQRVDNFAAGFVEGRRVGGRRRGVRRPEPHGSMPSWRAAAAIESAWRRAPTANGNTLRVRELAQSGLRRRDGSRARGVRVHPLDRAQEGARRRATCCVRSRHATSVVTVHCRSGRRWSRASSGTGLALKTPVLRSTAAGPAALVPDPVHGRRRATSLPDGMQASVRWDPLDPAPARPARAPDPTAPPDFGLVTPERLGDVVAPTALRIDTKYDVDPRQQRRRRRVATG